MARVARAVLARAVLARAVLARAVVALVVLARRVGWAVAQRRRGVARALGRTRVVEIRWSAHLAGRRAEPAATTCAGTRILCAVVLVCGLYG